MSAADRPGSAATWYRFSSSASAPASWIRRAYVTQPPTLVALRLAMIGTVAAVLARSSAARYRSAAPANDWTAGK